MTQALRGLGTLLKIGDGGSPTEVFTTIAEVVSITGPSLGLDTADATNMDSPGGWEEHIGTVLRSGEVGLDLNFHPTEATHRDASGGLLNDMKNKTVRNFELHFTDAGATVWTFAALVTGFEVSAPHDDRLSATVTLKLSGAPTLA